MPCGLHTRAGKSSRWRKLDPAKTAIAHPTQSDFHDVLQIDEIQLFRFDLRTRLPFRYGIAEMTAVPHLFVQLRGRFADRPGRGMAADHLPPKWFTKDPDQPLEAEIDEMLRVIRAACNRAIGQSADHAFGWWRAAYDEQMAWAQQEGIPPLLAHFGVSLVERALIDAACRVADRPFHEHLLAGGLGFTPSAVHPELQNFPWRSALPVRPRQRVNVRHTVGLGDALETAGESADRLNDGLPETLVESIRAYGIRHFKIKLRGQPEEDRQRLAELDAIFRKHCPNGFAFSLDLNESHRTIHEFKEGWNLLCREPLIADNPGRLLFIEQPVHRDGALESGPDQLGNLPGSPRVIIDESDAGIESLPRALALGYAGTSHKNCKGVFKGLANRCLLAKRESAAPHQRWIMSGEDLSNVGPVALLQDLAVQASLGVESVERNGHHYFRGLSAFPAEVNEAVLHAHPDLFTRHPDGWTTLQIRNGTAALGSLSGSGLGPDFALPLDFAEAIPL